MIDRTRPTRADARRNYDAVLAAAIQVLAERPDASMREIAAASGVGRTTVYRHFPQREDLVLALYRLVLDEAEEIVVAAVTTGRAAWARADAGTVEERATSTVVAGPATDDGPSAADGTTGAPADDAPTPQTALDHVVAMTTRLGALGERYRFLGAHQELQSEIEALTAAQSTEPLASYLDEARERGELRRDLSVAWMLDVLHHLTMAAAANLRNAASTPAELRRMLAATVRSALAPVD